MCKKNIQFLASMDGGLIYQNITPIELEKTRVRLETYIVASIILLVYTSENRYTYRLRAVYLFATIQTPQNTYEVWQQSNKTHFV